MNYLLDTNIIVIYSRNSDLARRIEADYQFFEEAHNLGISKVSLGELNSLAKQLDYGLKRQQRIEAILADLVQIDLNFEEIVKKYGDIDAYNQGKLQGKPLNDSARNMGKNDVWIAATASVFDLVLVTTDKDFQHLDGEFLALEYIDLSKYKK